VPSKVVKAKPEIKEVHSQDTEFVPIAKAFCFFERFMIIISSLVSEELEGVNPFSRQRRDQDESVRILFS
jgi:hypothetical protein